MNSEAPTLPAKPVKPIAHESHAGHARARKEAKTLRRVVLGVIVAGVTVWLVRFAWHACRFESTDDAYVTGRLHQISPQLTGQVAEVLVNDNQLVKAGDVLVRIDPQEFQIAVDHADAALMQARADKAKAEATASQAHALLEIATARASQARADLAQDVAELDLAQRTLARTRQLMESGHATSQADLDSAQSGYDSSQAKVESGKANLASAEATIDAAKASRVSFQAQVAAADAGLTVAETNVREARRRLALTTIVAPVAGRIGNRHIEVGNRVQEGQAVLALAEADPWVIANFKETQLARMHAGENVALNIDALPNVELHGMIDSIAPASGSEYALLPPDNATGNFNKVVQRVPVKILFDPDTLKNLGDRLRFGLSVEVDVRVR